MLSRHRFCCYIVFAQRVTLTLVRVTHFTHYPIYNFSIYWLFLSVICIGLHSVVDIMMDFELVDPGFKSRESHVFFFFFFLLLLFFFVLFFLFLCCFFILFVCFFFFFVFFYCHYNYSANLQFQHYCLYSVSPTLLLHMMPRPPALSALRFYT